MKRVLGVILLATMIGQGDGQAAAQSPSPNMERSEVFIETSEGRRHRFQVEVARTPHQLAMGLMFRTRLAADVGMLFDFGGDRPVSMWMKNTLVPLDMIFIRSDGRVANVVARAVPGSLQPRSSEGAVRGVLEVNGGTAERLGIRRGDRVVHTMFAGG